MSIRLSGTNSMALQSKIAVKTNTWVNASAMDWQQIPGMQVTITPNSTNSKILLMVSLNAAGYSVAFRLTRDGYVIPGAVGNAEGSRPQITARCTWFDGNHPNMMQMFYLDAPSTTSPVTYGIQCTGYSSGGYVYAAINRSWQDIDTSNTYGGRSMSSLTVIELAQ